MKGSPTFKYRNPRPALGTAVLTLGQLRYYFRRFWEERAYGISHVTGGKAAFLRYCGDDAVGYQIRDKILSKEPRSEYLSAQLQRVLSRKVLAVLRGEVIFVEDGGGRATWRPVLGEPEPPIPGEVLRPDHQFRIEHTAIGPRIRRF